MLAKKAPLASTTGKVRALSERTNAPPM